MPRTSTSPQSVQQILEEGQPWHPVTTLGGELALILFGAEERAEADALAAELREHGFEVGVHRTVALTSRVPEMLSVAIDTAQKWMVGEILKGTIPPALSWFADRLRRLGRPGAVRPHPSLLCQQRVRPWLDARFGQGAWRYDPDAIECCTLGGHVVFALVEENSGTEVVLEVHGLTGELEEVHFSLRMERERK